MRRCKVIVLTACFWVNGWMTVFASSKEGIRSTDFRKFTYEDCKGWGGRAISLQNGEYSNRDGLGETRSKLIAIRYVDLNADGREEAVIDIRTWSYGSMPYMDDYYVFQYRRGALNLIFHTSRVTPERMVVRRRAVIIVAPYWSDGSGPYCCPPYIEKTIYRWQGSKLSVAGRKLRRKQYPGMKVGRG